MLELLLAIWWLFKVIAFCIVVIAIMVVSLIICIYAIGFAIYGLWRLVNFFYLNLKANVKALGHYSRHSEA